MVDIGENLNSHSNDIIIRKKLRIWKVLKLASAYKAVFNYCRP